MNWLICERRQRIAGDRSLRSSPGNRAAKLLGRLSTSERELVIEQVSRYTGDAAKPVVPLLRANLDSAFVGSQKLKGLVRRPAEGAQ